MIQGNPGNRLEGGRRVRLEIYHTSSLPAGLPGVPVSVKQRFSGAESQLALCVSTLCAVLETTSLGIRV